MSRLILIRGIPGSGKSTLAQKLLNTGEVDVHIEADMYHIIDGVYKWHQDEVPDAHRWCQENTIIALSRGKKIVVSNTFTTMWELKPYFDMAKEFGIIPEIITCNGGYKNIHDVPEEIVLKMRNRFQEDISTLFKEVQ